MSETRMALLAEIDEIRKAAVLAADSLRGNAKTNVAVESVEPLVKLIKESEVDKKLGDLRYEENYGLLPNTVREFDIPDSFTRES